MAPSPVGGARSCALRSTARRQRRAQPPKTPRRTCTRRREGSSPRECGGCWNPSRDSAEAEPPPYAAAPSRPWDVPGARRSGATTFTTRVLHFLGRVVFCGILIRDWTPIHVFFHELVPSWDAASSSRPQSRRNVFRRRSRSRRIASRAGNRCLRVWRERGPPRDPPRKP